MFSKLRDLFQKEDLHQDDGVSYSSIQLATAALLVKLSQADSEVFIEEEEAIHKALQAHFSLRRHETEALVAAAEKSVNQAIDLYSYTKRLNEALAPEEKEEVVELLWRVVYADGIKDAEEEHMVRKIADLLYVSHDGFIRTRQKVEKSLGR
jgi:uncharacterized tellurite resistance protein B-like protein